MYGGRGGPLASRGYGPSGRPFRPLGVLGVGWVTLLVVLSAVAVAPVFGLPRAPGAPSVQPSKVAILPGAVAGAPDSPIPEGSPSYGTIVSTLDLVDNHSLPGNPPLATQDSPLSLVFDPANGDLYVRGYIGTSLTVVNGSTDEAVAEIAVPESQNPDGLTDPQSVDPVGNSVYVANEGPTSNLSIIDGATNRISGSITVGGSPDALVDDPTTHDLYVSNWGSKSVDVVDTLTNSLTTSIPVGPDPGSILFDPAAGEVFVANYGSDNVSVINTTSLKVVANIVTGSTPNALALDTQDDDVDVANGGAGTVTVIAAPATAATHGVNISVGDDPDALAYVPKENELYAVNGGAANVSIINQTRGKVVDNRAAGMAPFAAAYDPVNHDVYVLNSESPSFNVTVFDSATNQSVANVSLDNYFAYGIAVDTTNGNVDAVSEGSFLIAGSPPHAQANVTVISGVTNRPVASIPVNVYPTGLTYDPYLNTVIVADPGGNDTYLLNTTTGQIGGIRTAALLPTLSAFDSANDEVWVVDDNETPFYAAEVTILNPHLEEITNNTTGPSPTGIAYDSANGKFYLPDDVAGDVWVFNGTTSKFNTTIDVSAGANLKSDLYDPHDQEVYVLDYSTSQVIVINGSKDVIAKAIPVGTDPSSLAFDSRNNTIFVVNSGSDNVSVINDTTNSVVDTFRLDYPGAIAYDSANNLVYNAETDGNAVDVINASTYVSPGPAIPLGVYSSTHGIVYDPENQFLYISTEYNGSISVIPPATYAVTFVEKGLVAGTEWNVTLAGALNSSVGTSLGFQEPDGTYDFTVGVPSGYVTNVSSGSVTVDGSSRTIYFGFTAEVTTYSVSFVESGLPPSALWNVTLNGAKNSSTSNTIGFTEAPGTYSFTVGPYTGYVANNSSSSVTVVSASVVVEIGFLPVSSVFPVTFEEQGLAPSTTWTVTFHGVSNSSGTSSIGFLDPNGTWSFTVGTVTGYTVNVSSGSVTVAGVPQTVWVGFARVAVYPVTFTESGLTSSTPWTVTLAGVENGSRTNAIGFEEPNGTYSFTVGVVTGYSATPSSGPVTVSAGPAEQAIVFSSSAAALSVTLVAQPANLTIGNSSTLVASASGGTTPYSYAYAGLPTGCSSQNTSSLECTPTGTGSFPVVVTVTDAHGAIAHASATVNVSSTPGKPGGSSGSSTGLSSSELIGIGAAIAIGFLLLLVFLVARRRRRPPPAENAGSPAVPPGPAQ